MSVQRPEPRVIEVLTEMAGRALTEHRRATEDGEHSIADYQLGRRSAFLAAIDRIKELSMAERPEETDTNTLFQDADPIVVRRLVSTLAVEAPGVIEWLRQDAVAHPERSAEAVALIEEALAFYPDQVTQQRENRRQLGVYGRLPGVPDSAIEPGDYL